MKSILLKLIIITMCTAGFIHCVIDTYASDVTLNIQDEAIYGFNMLADESTDPIFGGDPIELTISCVQGIQMATFDITTGPVVVENLMTQKGQDVFDIDYIQNGSMLTISINRNIPSSVDEIIIHAIPNQFQYNDLGLGFGEFRFLHWDILSVSGTPIHADANSGSWMVITDYATGVPLQLHSSLTGDPLGQNFEIQLMGYINNDLYFRFKEPPSSFLDANGEVWLSYRPDPTLLIEEESDGCIAKEVEIIFVIKIIPPSGSEYSEQIIEIARKPQDQCPSGAFFIPAEIAISPQSYVADWLNLR